MRLFCCLFVCLLCCGASTTHAQNYTHPPPPPTPLTHTTKTNNSCIGQGCASDACINHFNHTAGWHKFRTSAGDTYGGAGVDNEMSPLAEYYGYTELALRGFWASLMR